MYLLRILLLSFTLVFSTNALSQEYQVPKNYKLEKKDDYKPYEKDILATIEFLETSSFDSDNKLRTEANAFFLKWITGCPYIKINIRGYVMNYTKENKGFLFTFLGGWVKFAIEHPDSVNDFNGNLAGLKSIIKVYELENDIEDDDNVEDLIKLKNEGKLESWLEEKLKEE